MQVKTKRNRCISFKNIRRLPSKIINQPSSSLIDKLKFDISKLFHLIANGSLFGNNILLLTSISEIGILR